MSCNMKDSVWLRWVINYQLAIAQYTTNTFSCKASSTATRALNRGIPSNSGPPLLFIFPSSVKILINSRLWRFPTSKSLGSWAGVIWKKKHQKNLAIRIMNRANRDNQIISGEAGNGIFLARMRLGIPSQRLSQN